MILATSSVLAGWKKQDTSDVGARHANLTVSGTAAHMVVAILTK